MSKAFTILIIDDNKKNLQITAHTLRKSGFDIALAQSAAEGYERLDDTKIDLVLLDIMMPEVDGFEMCKKIKSSNATKEIPVIFLTAKDKTIDLVKGFKCGGDDYITKPFKSDELLVRVKNHIKLVESKLTIQKQAGKILKMNKTRDKLYSVIAHDLRGPLANIHMTLNAINEGLIDYNDNEFSEIIMHLTNSTKETADLLDNLLFWTKSQKDMSVINKTRQSCISLVKNAASVLLPSAKNKNINIKIVGDEDIYCMVDKDMITTALRNLLNNAIKFSNEGGEIRISILLNNSYCQIEICDNGIGISNENLKKIVSNEHITTKGTTGESGSGLGLQLVKDFVNQNDGKIDIRSKLNKGTTVTIQFHNRD